jgi:hypothetical protein
VKSQERNLLLSHHDYLSGIEQRTVEIRERRTSSDDEPITGKCDRGKGKE